MLIAAAKEAENIRRQSGDTQEQARKDVRIRSKEGRVEYKETPIAQRVNDVIQWLVPSFQPKKEGIDSSNNNSSTNSGQIV